MNKFLDVLSLSRYRVRAFAQIYLVCNFVKIWKGFESLLKTQNVLHLRKFPRTILLFLELYIKRSEYMQNLPTDTLIVSDSFFFVFLHFLGITLNSYLKFCEKLYIDLYWRNTIFLSFLE